MKTIYLSRTFQPITITAIHPGETHLDPVWGECRRLTAKRFCLMAERAGKASDAILGLLGAISKAAEEDVYDGRTVGDWYGLVGLPAPEKKPDELVGVACPECGQRHLALEHGGRLWNDGVCDECWEKFAIQY